MKRFHVNVSVGATGVAWETFHTLDAIPIYGGDKEIAPKTGARCAPPAATASEPCCEPEVASTGQACCAS